MSCRCVQIGVYSDMSLNQLIFFSREIVLALEFKHCNYIHPVTKNFCVLHIQSNATIFHLVVHTFLLLFSEESSVIQVVVQKFKNQDV